MFGEEAIGGMRRIERARATRTVAEAFFNTKTKPKI